MKRWLACLFVLLVVALPSLGISTLSNYCATASGDVYLYWAGSTSNYYQFQVMDSLIDDTYNLPGTTYCLGSSGQECSLVLNGPQYGTGFSFRTRRCTSSTYATCGAWTSLQGPAHLTHYDSNGICALRGADLNCDGFVLAGDYSMRFIPAFECPTGSLSDASRSFLLYTPDAP